MARTVMRDSGEQAILIEFDAVELEAPRHEVAITEYPIELGADLTDHVRQKAVQLRLVCHVTNSPARVGLTQMEGVTPLRDMTVYVREPIIATPPSAQLPTSVAGFPLTRTVPVQASVRTWAPEGFKIQRVQNVYGLLVKSMNEAREFTVSTDLLGDFDRMLVKSVSTERTGQTGNGLKLEIELQQVFYAELVRRDVSHLFKTKPKHKASEPVKDEGKKEPEVTDKQTDTHLQTLWSLGGDLLESVL